MKGKGEEEGLGARSDGQQKQVERKWEEENVGPASSTVSLNAL